jgi:hypothetical protein
MTTISKFKKFGLMMLALGAITMTSCEKDEEVTPEEEHDHEVITDVHLVFTNTADANDVIEFSAQDPDGEGIEELTVLDTIQLDTSKTYILTFEIMNNLEEDEHDHKMFSGEGEDIGAEILEEADEHQVFFSFTNDAFANPMGDGNIDNASDAVNYNDEDSNGNPLGLNTTWTTPSTSTSNGNFTVRLQHQPDVKTATSTANTGDTDFEISFVMNIE